MSLTLGVQDSFHIMLSCPHTKGYTTVIFFYLTMLVFHRIVSDRPNTLLFSNLSSRLFRCTIVSASCWRMCHMLSYVLSLSHFHLFCPRLLPPTFTYNLVRKYIVNTMHHDIWAYLYLNTLYWLLGLIL